MGENFVAPLFFLSLNHLANENVLRIPNVFIMPETCQRAEILACQSNGGECKSTTDTSWLDFRQKACLISLSCQFMHSKQFPHLDNESQPHLPGKKGGEFHLIITANSAEKLAARCLEQCVGNCRTMPHI